MFVDPETGQSNPMIIGAATEAIAGEGAILTAGGYDCHIHFICAQQIDEGLASGVTTMTGGGTGPATGTNATTCTPGIWNIHRMLEASDEYPMNLGYLGKGNCSTSEPLANRCSPARLALSCTRTGARHRRRSIAVSASLMNSTCRSPFTPTR
ncbi:MAG: hypothetical protein CM1200mP29_16660 [Verrucomicrobiota bacterium]|nr:MAG: hypothetical protein CM1200mP29_16660 [Verrucomicrobiota bacterium]